MKAELEIVDIEHGAIRPAPENPNEMSPAQMKALREEIRLRGFVQPVLVRKVEIDSANPQVEYEIVDGEHRWRLLGELGAETVPCVVEESDDVSAKVRQITMNRLRGAFVPIKLAHLLADLTNAVPEAEMRKRLAMDKSDMTGYLDLAGYLEPDDPVEREPAEPKPGVEVAVVATPTQAATLADVLGRLTGGKPEDEPKVIAKLAKDSLA